MDAGKWQPHVFRFGRHNMVALLRLFLLAVNGSFRVATLQRMMPFNIPPCLLGLARLFIAVGSGLR